MSVFENPLKSAKAKFKEEIQLQIQNHKKAAMHLEAAAKNHLEAAKHHEEEHHELAAICSLAAHNYTEMAIEKQNRLVKSSL